MPKRFFVSLAVAPLAAGLALQGAAFAELTARQEVRKEVVTRDAAGKETVSLVPAEKVTPGETVVYSISYVNNDAAPADDVVLVMPVPKEVAYVEGSVAGDSANISFSADGGSTYVARGRLTIVEAGTVRPARGDEITHIKWTMSGPIASSVDGVVSYRAIVR